jgi:hypothetical protein
VVVVLSHATARLAAAISWVALTIKDWAGHAGLPFAEHCFKLDPKANPAKRVVNVSQSSNQVLYLVMPSHYNLQRHATPSSWAQAAFAL